jgi:hypothetical protein
MDDGLNKDLKPIYIGMYLPDILEYTAGDLTTGSPYLFSVQAINRNGNSVHSTTATYYACVEPPVVGTPLLVSADRVAMTVTIEWQKPTDNGGCSLLGYRLYRTDGSSDKFDQTTPAILVATLSAINPSITQHTIDLSATGTVGHIYKFMLEAYNQAGQTTSSSLYVALASLPAKPASVPASITSLTGPTQLAIQFELFDTAAEDGGSPILQYELQYDDGARGSYKSMFTLNPINIITDGIQHGLEYRLRYRAQHFNGWGPLSDIAYIVAAGIPLKPPAPLYVSTTSTHATVMLLQTPDDAGADISSYELYIDEI